MTDIFTPVDDDQVVDVKLEDLVGEGKKFADVNALAKGKAEADRFINKLIRELEEARAANKSQASLEEIKTQISQLAKPPQSNEPAPPPQTPTGTPVDIEQVVSALLEKKTTEERVKSNRQIVEDKVLEKWGADAQLNINKKAKELGVDLAYLQKIALESPSAFFRLTGLDQVQSAPPPPPAPKSIFNTSARSTQETDKRTDKWYKEQKAKNPALRASAEFRAQEMKDALALGEAFFDA